MIRVAYKRTAIAALGSQIAEGWCSPNVKDDLMPRYFLNVTNGQRDVDPDGEILADLSSARAAAVETARELVIDGIRSGKGMGLDRHIEIVHESGEIVDDVRFVDAMP